MKKGLRQMKTSCEVIALETLKFYVTLIEVNGFSRRKMRERRSFEQDNMLRKLS